MERTSPLGPLRKNNRFVNAEMTQWRASVIYCLHKRKQLALHLAMNTDERLSKPAKKALAYALAYGVAPQFVFGQIIDLPAARFMREDLHLTPVEFATLGALCGIPFYLTPLFGYIRDRWSPLGLGDRGFFVVMPPIAMMGFFGIAALPFKYNTFLAGALLVVFAQNALGASSYAAAVSIAKRSDIVSKFVAGNTLAGGIFGALTALAGGWAAIHIPYRLFICLEGFACFGLLEFGIFRPRAVPLPERDSEFERRDFRADLKRLIRNRTFWGVFCFSVLWQFSPAGDTVLNYFIQDKLHGTIQSVGIYKSVGSLGGWCAALCWPALRRRWSAWRLLLATCFLSIFQFVPLYFAHTVVTAYFVAWPIFFIGVLTVIPLFEFQIRSCEDGLEGITLAVIGVCSGLVGTASNVWGASLYQRSGVLPVIWGTAISSFLAIPFILLIPRDKAEQPAIVDYQAERKAA